MTEVQARMLVLQHRATPVRTVNGVEWFKLPNGNWLAMQKQPNGQAVLTQVAKDKCACG